MKTERHLRWTGGVGAPGARFAPLSLSPSPSRRPPLGITSVRLVALALIGLIPTLARAQLGASPGSIVVEAASGRVIAADHPDERRFPASLTKLMTLYLTFQALQNHRVSLHHPIPVSAHAASREPMKLWLKPGMRVTVEQCILGMVTLSANDAASAIGEFLGGSETRFAHLMTRHARRLGMTRTVFRNASGLPDPAQVTTARDMSRLARALIHDFPQDYHYFSVRSFVFHGRAIYGHNPMLGRYPGADGLKTGYTSAAGFNLATSAQRDGVRLVGIVLGAPDPVRRSATMISLLDDGFARYQPPMLRPGPVFSPPRLIAVAEAASPPRIAAPRPAPAGYGVQVGSFPTQRTALHAVRRTVATVGGVAHVRRRQTRHHPVWTGQVVSLTRKDALRACPRQRRRARLCFIMKPNGRRWDP